MLTTFYLTKNDHRWVTFIYLKTIKRAAPRSAKRGADLRRAPELGEAWRRGPSSGSAKRSAEPGVPVRRLTRAPRPPALPESSLPLGGAETPAANAASLRPSTPESSASLPWGTADLA